MISFEDEFYRKLYSYVAQGGSAEDLFRKSGIADPVLASIWTLADPNGTGFLDYATFCGACRLIAHAQNGMMPSEEALQIEPASLPYFDLSDIDTDPQQAYLDVQTMPPVVLPMAPVLQDDSEFSQWFYELDTDQDGYLNGDQAREIFEKSGLDDTVLFDIWGQADQDQDGLLTLSEFTTACQLIQQYVQQADPSSPQVQLQVPLTPPREPVATPPELDLFAVPVGDDVWGTPTNSLIDATGGEVSDGAKKSRKKKNKKTADPPEKTPEDDLSFGDLVKTETLKQSESTKKQVAIADSSGGDPDHGDVFVSTRVKETSTPALNPIDDKIRDNLGLLSEEIRSRLQRSVDLDYADVRSLLVLVERENQQKIKDAKEVDSLVSRKEEFQKELEELRLEYELLKEERRKLDRSRLETIKDCEAFQMLILQLKNEIDQTKADINTLTEKNEWLKSALLSARQQTEAMDLARKKALQEIEQEEARLRDLQNEIEALKLKAEQARRDKEQLQSENLVLEQQFTDADQDRYLMISGSEAQRQRLQTLRSERMIQLEERRKVQDSMSQLDHGWQQPHHRNPQLPAPHILADRVHKQHRVSEEPPQCIFSQDRKGVPNSAAVISPTWVAPRASEPLQKWERFDDVSESRPPRHA